MLAEQVGERIARYRKRQGMTQADLGRRFSRPRSHVAICNIERGVTKPDVDQLAEIAGLLDVSLADLLGLDTTRPPAGRKNRERLFIARMLLAYVALLLCETCDPDVHEAKASIAHAQGRLSKALELEGA